MTEPVTPLSGVNPRTAPIAHVPASNCTGIAATQPFAPSDRQQFVIFALDQQRYGVDIMSVREIRRMQPITFLPGAPDYICGVINLRGCILPVCDLRTRFWQGRSVPEPGHGIVIVAIEGRMNGLLVDEVLDIVSITAGDIAPVPQVRARAASLMFKGLVTSTSGMTIVLDIEQLFAGAEVGGSVSDKGH